MLASIVRTCTIHDPDARASATSFDAIESMLGAAIRHSRTMRLIDLQKFFSDDFLITRDTDAFLKVHHIDTDELIEFLLSIDVHYLNVKQVERLTAIFRNGSV